MENEFPDTKTLHWVGFNQVQGAEGRTTPAAYTEDDIRTEPSVKELLDKGYELVSFSDPLTDQYTRTVTVVLQRV